MSRRRGAPYADEVQDEGRVLIYEGHDRPRARDSADPKTLDQELTTPSGAPTQNGLFFGAARRHVDNGGPAELVQAYEKMRSGIWVYNGAFRLVDGWAERINGRRVFKFRLEVAPDQAALGDERETPPNQHRVIPTDVKLEVWRRDGGRCVQCGRTDNLHFDHIIPYSRGGSSLTAANVQLLCARRNLAKRDRIE